MKILFCHHRFVYNFCFLVSFWRLNNYLGDWLNLIPDPIACFNSLTLLFVLVKRANLFDTFHCQSQHLTMRHSIFEVTNRKVTHWHYNHTPTVTLSFFIHFSLSPLIFGWIELTPTHENTLFTAVLILGWPWELQLTHSTISLFKYRSI